MPVETVRHAVADGNRLGAVLVGERVEPGFELRAHRRQPFTARNGAVVSKEGGAARVGAKPSGLTAGTGTAAGALRMRRQRQHGKAEAESGSCEIGRLHPHTGTIAQRHH